MDDVWSLSGIARDLENYISIIKNNAVDSLFNINNLHDLKDAMNRDAMAEKDYCCIENLEVEFYQRNPIAKTIPGMNSFGISLVNTLISKSDVNAEVYDPIAIYTFDMVITGFSDDAIFKAAWHLDKNIVEEDDGEQKYSHPLYHFQYGGNQLDGISTGGLMLMGAPRLPHPPMDIFLSIHFILNNYFNKEENCYSGLKNIFSDENYIDILERAKERMWYPYFKGLNDREGTHLDLNLKNLFPLAMTM